MAKPAAAAHPAVTSLPPVTPVTPVTPVAEPVPEAPLVSIRVQACPGEGTTASIDRRSAFEVTNLGHTVEVPAGIHLFSWISEGESHEVTLEVEGRRTVCHAFARDAACGSCND